MPTSNRIGKEAAVEKISHRLGVAKDTVYRSREHRKLPDGLYRQNMPAFDEVVVREQLVNALAHRLYTQRGDIPSSLHPDLLEVVVRHGR